MNVDKEVFEPVLEKPCQAQLLPGSRVTTSLGRNSPDIPLLKSKKLIYVLTGVIVVQIIGLVYLIYDKLVVSDSRDNNNSQSCGENKNILHRDYEQFPMDLDYINDYDYEGATLESNITSAQYDTSPWDVYDIKPRCFSMCEPPELFFRYQLKGTVH